MTSSRNATATTAVTFAALAAVAVLVACGSDGPRDAASVTTSTSGNIVTKTSTDLGSIVIGWGEEHSDTEITTPQPGQVTARCTGRGDDLAVDITAPHGWKIQARHGSPTLRVENTDQHLAATDIDTTDRFLAAADVDASSKFLDTLQGVSWSEGDELDIAAAADAPADWQRTHSGRVYLSIHVDCR